MTTIIEGYIAKLTKDCLLADFVQEIDRIKNIIRALLKLIPSYIIQGEVYFGILDLH